MERELNKLSNDTNYNKENLNFQTLRSLFLKVCQLDKFRLSSSLFIHNTIVISTEELRRSHILDKPKNTFRVVLFANNQSLIMQMHSET